MQKALVIFGLAICSLSLNAAVECVVCWGPTFDRVCLYDGETDSRCEIWQSINGWWFCLDAFDLCSDLPGGGSGKIDPGPPTN